MALVFDVVLGQIGVDRNAEAFIRALDAYPVAAFIDSGLAPFVIQLFDPEVAEQQAPPWWSYWQPRSGALGP